MTDAPTGSPSQTPAPTSSGPQLKWGDWNCSLSSDPVDSLLTLRHDAGLTANTGDCPQFGTQVQVSIAGLVQRFWGDVDCSNEINPIDSLKILRADAGLNVSQESDCPEIGADI